MQDVYRSAYITISSIAGRNDHAGMFHDRDIARVAPTVVGIRPSAHGTALLFRHDLEIGYAQDLSFGTDNILIRRAWCLQERLLSPRVLHFGANQLFWECREVTACEINPTNATAVITSGTVLWKPLLFVIVVPGLEDLWDKLFQEWYRCIYMYTTCKLTVPSDKLIAISGLANDMRCALQKTWPEKKHRYMVGL
jgi:hypothetical protein